MEGLRLFSDEELGGLRLPLFLGVGGRDLLLRSEESASRLKRLQAEAEVCLKPGAGHAIIDMGERVADFLARKA